MVHLAATTTNANSKTIAELFVQHFWKLHGIPKQIVSDRGSQFASAFNKQVCKMVGTQQCLSTAFHPQSDGQTERTNRVLEEMLRHFIG